MIDLTKKTYSNTLELGPHTATLVKAAVAYHESGNHDKDFLRLDFVMADNGRKFNDNRFEASLDRFINQVKEQLAITDPDIQIQTVLDILIIERTVLNLWTSDKADKKTGKIYRNNDFVAPTVIAPPAPDTTPDKF
jgi:hypothetical protein